MSSPEVAPEELQLLYNGAQVMLIQYMIAKGVIETMDDYIKRYAAVFEMLAKGVLEAPDHDWDSLRQQVDKITGKPPL